MICEKCKNGIEHVWITGKNPEDKHLEEIIEYGEEAIIHVSDEWAEKTPNPAEVIKCPYCMKFPLENETIRQEKYRALVMTKNTPNLDKAEEIIKKALGSLSDCLMPITEYREDIKTGCIIDYDGFGEYYDIWGTKRGYSDFNLADIDRAIANGIVFVAWFNK